ncbi:MAG: glucose 1-dehydrogenase [Acidimicrobiaceae bacterium]|nr:glucose 1-dehydrogenase [Acidimicrobiaceae bacterium]MDE0605977.1 glucose 1-dehydrogenase [Acidimicrobiaceae bacterium]
MDVSTLRSLFDLSGRTAVVTGGTRGIGRAVAEGFAAAGANVVVASRKEAACEATQAHLESMGADALGIAVNMGDPDSAETIVGAAVDRFGGLDVVVNNAANPLAAPVGSQDTGSWQKSFEVNLQGPALLIGAAVDHLSAGGRGAVVNVISVGAFQFARGVSIYASMKAALLSVTRSFAGELAEQGIRVNALAPGPVNTDMVRNVGEGAAEHMGARTLLKRCAEPDEMVGAALFLAGDASSYMTGQVIVVDGGMHPH